MRWLANISTMFIEPEHFVLAAKSEERVDTRKFLLVGRTTCREEKASTSGCYRPFDQCKENWVFENMVEFFLPKLF